MQNIENNFSLKSYNTFNLDVKADFFLKTNNIDFIISVLKDSFFSKQRKLVIGGGSNLLFTKDFDGLILYPDIKGIEILSEDESSIIVKVGAGVNWDYFVEHCVSNNWYGIENLSLIPGSVGASPIQNIGAYGKEVKDVIDSVEFINLDNFNFEAITKSQCKFDYRDSVFKQELRNRVLITGVVFRLSKQPDFNLSYGAIESELTNFSEVNQKNVRQAIINIRNKKLPDPKVLGNAGSFFKNPLVSSEHAAFLTKNYSEIPLYPTKSDCKKVAAGWLIEQCGWRGKRIGDAGVHENQALVLVNYGGAKGADILSLATDIKNSVQDKFKISLSFEVNIV